MRRCEPSEIEAGAGFALRLFLWLSAPQLRASCHNGMQLTTTRILNTTNEMQGKCLSGLNLDFCLEKCC